MSLLSDTAGLFENVGKAVKGFDAFESTVSKNIGDLSYVFGISPPAPTPAKVTPKTPEQTAGLAGVSPWVWVGVGGLALILLLRR